MDNTAKHETTVRVERLEGLREVALSLAAPTRFDADDELRAIVTVRSRSEDRAREFYARCRYLMETTPGAGVKGIVHSLARDPQEPIGLPTPKQLGEAIAGMSLPDVIAAFDAWAESGRTSTDSLEAVCMRIGRIWRCREVDRTVRLVLAMRGEAKP